MSRTARTLHHPDGQVFTFDAGALCLELVSTSGGAGWRARFEVLHTPADFPRWVAEGRLDLRAHGVEPADVAVTDDDLAAVKRLREALWAAADAVVTGGHPDPVDLATVNELAAGPVPVPQIEPAGQARFWRRPVTAGQLTATIARDAVGTLSEPTVRRIRRCAGANCYLIYLDTSRPGHRRWCSMQRCGNRAKASGFRRRHPTQGGSP